MKALAINLSLVVCAIGLRLNSQACINDSFGGASLQGGAEPTLVSAVHGAVTTGPSLATVKSRLDELLAAPKQNDPAWLNDVAGAWLRLGDPGQALALLGPVAGKYPKDYGIHANLGTAYHLLGRYAEATKEIAIDLRINPKGHNGLEVYHLALLQYLAADDEWHARHLFVDEWTDAFWSPPTSEGLNEALIARGLHPPGAACMPEYRNRLNLATSPAQDRGVAYMLSLNQSEPACFVMAGLLALRSHDGTTAREAFTKAVKLGSPQADQINLWIAWIDSHNQAEPNAVSGALPFIAVAFIALAILSYRKLST